MTTTIYKRIGLYLVIGLIAGLAIFELPHTKSYRQTAMVEKLDVATMSQRADLIVTGTVLKKLGTSRQTDPTGEDMVYTRWQIQPDRTIKGSGNTKIVVRTLGGRYLTTIVDVEDQTTFAIGEKVMLFLQQAPDWKGDYRVTGEFQGKYQLTGSGDELTATQAETNQTQPVSNLEKSITEAL